MPRSVVLSLQSDSPWLPQFELLWQQRRQAAGDTPERIERLISEGAVRSAVDDPAVQIYVAILGDDIAGYAITSRNPAAALLGGTPLVVDDLHVRPGDKECVARALLMHIAHRADREGQPEIACELPTSAKDENRTMARLGFGAVSTVRVASTAALVRSLSANAAAQGQVSVLHHRRMLRARHLTGS